MLELKNIKKDYYVAGLPSTALNKVNLTFKENEFVAILGASGSGKTTLLNLIGGLDHYTEGDLLVDGKSTKNFKDWEWDAYRNSTIGFVFQTYNLIPHLSVLDNVEMALRLSGISAKERKTRAIKVLTDVGLIDHLHKRPNQLSGGQMQRVSIARALVNNPKVLLADEPTGALDTKTSTQIMELIKEISKDRLVIMVTHNSEIANAYSDRIITLVDGLVVEDTNPTPVQTLAKTSRLINKKTSMSFLTAIKTSFKNLLTKRGRTIITSFAGSIGIIGIALVLSISTGMTSYTNALQSDSLAGFPITIASQISTTRFNGPDFIVNETEGEFPSENTIITYDQTANTVTHKNILDQNFLTYLQGMDDALYNSISYSRAMQLNIVGQNSNDEYIKISTATTSSFFSSSSDFAEVPDSSEFIASQYDLLMGAFPTTANDLVLIVDSYNRISINLLENLGINISETYVFEDFIGMEFKAVPNNTYYSENAGVFVGSSDYQALYQAPESVSLEIVGILRVNKDASSEILPTGIGYTTHLTDALLENALVSEVVEAQRLSPTIDVLTGANFNMVATYDNAIKKLGGVTTPSSVQIYPVSFDSKDAIKKYLDLYNVGKTQELSIVYSDLAEQISSTISSLINTITIILAGFAGISLVVSSVMIGIITYVSVVERTKEIGIMRSLGARKKDISRIFNAEALLIGLTSGIIGVILAYVINIPLSLVIDNLIGVANFSNLLIYHAFLLIVLSTVLTLIAGLVPSRIASKKDPVIALRTE